MFFDNNFRLSIPFITVLATFIIFILLICIIRLFISPYILMTVYDDCNFLNYQHQYVLRLLFVGISSTYQPETTTVTVRIDHSIRRCRDIPFTPEIMERSTIYKGLHCAKIFIRTVERYHDIKCVTIHHNGIGSILVDSVELQDVDQPNSIIATVQFPIGEERSMQKIRAFPFGREKLTLIEDDIRPTSNVTCLEIYYFIYASLNIIYSLNAYTFMVKCSSQPGAECRFQMILMLGLISCGISCAIFIFLIIPFRYIIKVYYHNNMGRGCCKFARFIYLLIVLLVGFMTAAFTCELSMKNEFTKVNESNHLFRADIFWIVTTCFSIFLYFCVICISIPIAIFIDFIQLSNHDQSWRQQLQETWIRAQQHSYVGKRRRRIKRPNLSAWNSYRSAEAQSLLTTNRLQQDDYNNNNTDNDTTVSTMNSSSADRDTYYNMLIKRKNEIKSISTFINQPIKLRGGGSNNAAFGGGGFSFRKKFKQKNRQRPQQRLKPPGGATIVNNNNDNQSNRTNRLKMVDKPIDEAALHSVSSAGENYYRLMLKHQKVRSVSQYKKY